MARKRKSRRSAPSQQKKGSTRETTGLLGKKLVEAIAKKEDQEMQSEQKIPNPPHASKRVVAEGTNVDAGSRQKGKKAGKKTIEVKGKSGARKVEVLSVAYTYGTSRLKKTGKRVLKQSHPVKNKKTQKTVPPKKSPIRPFVKEGVWHPVDQTPTVNLKTTKGGKISKKPQKRLVSDNRLSWQVFEGSYSDERDIVIGFDLGTACTKVMLQDRNLRTAFAISFGEFAYKDNDYFIPTRVFVDDFGKIGFHADGTEINDIKVKFIENPDHPLFEKRSNNQKATAFDLAGAYIGLVLLQVRRWFNEYKAADYARSKITWQLNLGIPSRDYENKKVVKALRVAALTGWNLTLGHVDEISLKAVKEARELAENQLNHAEEMIDPERIHWEDVIVIPEIIAEVLGYAGSPMRQNGMYLMVDVGATTLDVSTFILDEEDDEDTYPILFADVAKLGGYELHKSRIKKVVNIFQDKLCVLSDSCDGISPLPEHAKYFPDLSHEDRTSFSDHDHVFSEKCSLAVRKVVGTTKKKRNPLSDAWQQGLPVFLCGGGSQIELYGKSIKYAFDALEPMGIQGFRFVPLPKPDNLETQDIPPRDYHRLAVSYGLSFSEIDIGKIIAQKELDDIDPQKPILDTESIFVDKDMV